MSPVLRVFVTVGCTMCLSGVVTSCTMFMLVAWLRGQGGRIVDEVAERRWSDDIQ